MPINNEVNDQIENSNDISLNEDINIENVKENFDNNIKNYNNNINNFKKIKDEMVKKCKYNNKDNKVDQSYQLFWEFEIWKKAEEINFKNELKDKEEEHLIKLNDK